MLAIATSREDHGDPHDERATFRPGDQPAPMRFLLSFAWVGWTVVNQSPASIVFGQAGSASDPAPNHAAMVALYFMYYNFGRVPSDAPGHHSDGSWRR